MTTFKPKAYILIGLPGTGKSTWIKKQTWALGLTVVSTDAFVEDYARAQGKTYSEVFESYMPRAVELMVEQVKAAKELGHTIIWDQTSTTIASRKRKFNMLGDKYDMIAVVFMSPDKEEWQRRLASRPGKVIPEHVLLDMQKNFEYPRYAEGFSKMYLVG
jgi:predicted kinase